VSAVKSRLHRARVTLASQASPSQPHIAQRTSATLTAAAA
jgi:hypothetical protein